MSKQQTILIVADNSKDIQFLIDSLTGTVRIESARGGEQALTIAATQKPDLIILDVLLPGLDPHELCRQLRKNTQLVCSHIIFIHKQGTAEERVRAYASGADDFITTAAAPEELLAKATMHLKFAANEQSFQRINVDLEEKVRIRSEQLVSLERAAFLGIHSVEIIHNLNGPLSIAISNLDALGRSHPGDPFVNDAQQALSKMQLIVKSLLKANKQDDSSLKDVDINAVLRDELRLLDVDTVFKYKTTVNVSLDNVPTIRGQPIHFSQIFSNLIKNALDAMWTSERKELNISTTLKGDHIEVTIADSGMGIQPEHLKRIFDPFFTTKPSEAKGGAPIGNGLGLASAKRILTRYGAHIKFDSTLGRGTTVQLQIPVEVTAPQTSAPASKPRQVARFRPAAPPENEKARLQALHSYAILDTTKEQAYEDFVFLAASICGMPISAISLIDSNRQWFKAALGLGEIKETRREVAFCAHTIQGISPLIVEDVLQDDRFAENPLVLGAPHIRFYAGIPLVTPDGYAIGSICVIDQTPANLTAQQLMCLQAIARQVMAQLEGRRAAASYGGGRR